MCLQGTLLVSDNPPSQVFKGKERRLIVFEQSLIIADVTGPKKEFCNPYYVYKSHIMVTSSSLLINTGKGSGILARTEKLKLCWKEFRIHMGRHVCFIFLFFFFS